MSRKRTTTPDGLSDHQRRLVDEYLIDLNVSAAARRAGYSPASAKASSNLLTPAVTAAIEAALAQRAARTAVAADKVVAELAKLAFANMLDFVTIGADGLPRFDLTGLTREDGAAIQALTVDYWRPPVVRKRDRTTPSGGGSRSEGGGPGQGPETRHPDTAPAIRRIRLQLADKRAALMDLARHLGIAWPDQAPAPEPIIRLIRVATGVPRAGDEEELAERARQERLAGPG